MARENFYTDNPDIKFNLDNLDLSEAIRIMEDNYQQAKQYPYAPRDEEEARKFYDMSMKVIGDIVANVVAPNAESVDEEGSNLVGDDVKYAEGIKEDLQVLLGADFGGITLPRKYGGLNFPTVVSSMIVEMISRGDASLMNLIGLQDIGETINDFASDEIKEKYLPMFTSGAVTGAMILTEPDAGSDLQAVQTKAVYDEKIGKWRLYGVKRFITNGNAKISLVLARSEEGTKDGRGLSMFLIERDETVKIRRTEHKHGIHGSPTTELQFNGTPALLIGKRRMGLIKYVMSLMNGARVAVSAQAVGIAEAAYREALKYAKEREQFGTAIINFPAVYDMLTKMKVSIEAGRALQYETCRFVDYKKAYTHLVEKGDADQETKKLLKKYTNYAALLTPMTKAYNTEMANKVAYDAMQVHGGTGYMKDFPVERLARDARITNIYEGTTQLQVVAAIGGMVSGVLEDLLLEEFPEYTVNYSSASNSLVQDIKKLRDEFISVLNLYREHHDEEYKNYFARNIVYMGIDVFISHKLTKMAEVDDHKRVVARSFLDMAFARQAELGFPIKQNLTSTMENKSVLLGL